MAASKKVVIKGLLDNGTESPKAIQQALAAQGIECSLPTINNAKAEWKQARKEAKKAAKQGSTPAPEPAEPDASKPEASTTSKPEIDVTATLSALAKVKALVDDYGPANVAALLKAVSN